MTVTGLLGVMVVVLAISAYVGESHAAMRAVRPMRPWFIVSDVIGGLFGLVVAVMSFGPQFLSG